RKQALVQNSLLPECDEPEEMHLEGMVTPIHQGMDMSPHMRKPRTLQKAWEASTYEQVLPKFTANGFPRFQQPIPCRMSRLAHPGHGIDLLRNDVPSRAREPSHLPQHVFWVRNVDQQKPLVNQIKPGVRQSGTSGIAGDNLRIRKALANRPRLGVLDHAL